jgi:hypothetical protein
VISHALSDFGRVGELFSAAEASDHIQPVSISAASDFRNVKTYQDSADIRNMAVFERIGDVSRQAIRLQRNDTPVKWAPWVETPDSQTYGCVSGFLT